jgi:hypothetical protein
MSADPSDSHTARKFQETAEERQKGARTIAVTLDGNTVMLSATDQTWAYKEDGKWTETEIYNTSCH